MPDLSAVLNACERALDAGDTTGVEHRIKALAQHVGHNDEEQFDRVRTKLYALKDKKAQAAIEAKHAELLAADQPATEPPSEVAE